ncbi:MAG: DUF86 domain-containing protein [Acidimicrobiia bacterium]
MSELLIGHTADPQRLANDPVIQAAAQRWIEVLGEAASHVSDELKAAHPEISWREIAGIRVILAHGYFHVDQDIVSDVILNDVPQLRTHLLSIADSLSDD